jgi:hypothetical protein
MLAWFSLLARAYAWFAAPVSGFDGPALRLAPERARLTRRIATRPPRRRTIDA